MFQISLLNERWDRTAFSCSSYPLNNYFYQQVTQDIRRRIASCFVATQEPFIIGYYTLSSASILINELPQEISKKLPRYPTLPAIRIGRLAVDQTFEKQGIGGALIADAFKRTLKSKIAAYALIVDAKDQTASLFYQHHGFISFPHDKMKLFLPLETVSKSLNVL